MNECMNGERGFQAAEQREVEKKKKSNFRPSSIKRACKMMMGLKR
jgi:hypothetical protein